MRLYATDNLKGVSELLRTHAPHPIFRDLLRFVGAFFVLYLLATVPWTMDIIKHVFMRDGIPPLACDNLFALWTIGIFYFALFVCWLSVSAVLLILVAQAVMVRAFGWTSLAAGFLVELAIEPLPFGAHSLIHIDWGSDTRSALIVHSWTYEHPLAIARLRDWVRSELQH